MADPAAPATNVYRQGSGVKWPSRRRSRASGTHGPPLARRAPRNRRRVRRDAASGPGDDVSSSAVLVLSSDPLAAALLGAVIELQGRTPQFPQADESPRAALLRVRPHMVVVDCDHEDGCSESFIGPAIMTGSQVILFRSRRTRRDVSEMAHRFGLRTIGMPDEHELLTSLLHDLVP